MALLKLLKLSFLLFLPVFLISFKAYAKDWSKIYTQKSPSIPILNHLGGVCSGALIAKDTTLTAAHCVDRLYNVYLNYGKQEISATVVYMNPSSDLAILKHKEITNLPILTIKSNDKNLQVGEELATIGHPSPSSVFGRTPFSKDYTYLMSRGILSKKTKKEIISDMSMSPGNSGGPVFSSDGDLVGVVSRKRVDVGVGDIGLSTNHIEIHKAVKLSKNKKEALPLSLAKTSMYTNLSYNYVFQRDSSSNLKEFNVGTFDLGFSFRSRWDLMWSFKLHNPKGVSQYHDTRIGYKFPFERDNHSYLFVSPFVSSLKVNQRHVDGLGVKLSHSILPMGISLVVYSEDDIVGKLSTLEWHFGATF